MKKEYPKIQQVSIKGILCRNDKILFLKTATRGIYELPGGRIDFGESAKQTFKREIEEELGFKKNKNRKFSKHLVVYKC